MLYEFTCRGKKWYDEDESYLIKSDNPYNALTKLRIKYGENIYRRCYMVFDCDNQKCVKDLFSYGMHRERKIRDVGRKYYHKVLTRG